MKNVRASYPVFSKFLIEYINMSSLIVNGSVNSFNSKSEESSSAHISKEFNIQSDKNETLPKDTIDITLDSKYGDNKVLLISEKRNKVILPYTFEDLNRVLTKSKSYNSLQEVIDKKYTVPLSRYKNAVISRFKETYNLMKKKERASLADSLDLALELAFNSSLNPAVITACKNLDQLEFYLDCLELNELNKFDYFEVKYEVLPFKRTGR